MYLGMSSNRSDISSVNSTTEIKWLKIAHHTLLNGNNVFWYLSCLEVKDVSWSFQERIHPVLQSYFISYKSQIDGLVIQRFVGI